MDQKTVDASEKSCHNAMVSDTATDNGCLTVRYAEISDLPEVMVMYMAALKELSNIVVKPSEDKCAQEVIASWSQAPCVLLEKLGRIVGFAGLKTVIPAYSEQTVISEYMFYIAPEERSYKAARLLSEECKAISDRFGLPLIFTHFIKNSTIERKEKFLKKWNYSPFGIVCTYGGLNG